MEDYIVRIKSFDEDNECIENGTGIFIGDNKILTALHTVEGYINKVIIDKREIEAKILKNNDSVAILETEENIEFEYASNFTIDEIFDSESDWNVKGFITNDLIEHSMNGKGITYSCTEDKHWDSYLEHITTGKSNDYSGLSGSPVICNNRIIGILQMQFTNINGKLGVRLSSVDMFKELLEQKNIKENEYKSILKQKCLDFTKIQIKKNIKSKKYIPNIFVEEGKYKENMRYFADPYLFLKKSISEVKKINFDKYNKFILEYNEKIIDFDKFKVDFNIEELEEIYNSFYKEITYAEEIIETLKKRSYTEEKSSLSNFYSIKQNNFNNSIEYFLSTVKSNLKYISKSFILLTNEAGQGKTNFLCDFTLNFLIRKNYFTLYFNAYDFREPPFELLKKKLRISESYSLKYIFKVLNKDWEETNKPFVIVIDGLNENTSLDNFGGYIKDFLEECNKYPFFKVIMTTRNEFLDERFSIINEGDYKEKYEHINMNYRSDVFKNRIFWGYLDFFNIEIKKNTLTEISYKKLTDDILLLRFFCEINEDKKQIYLYDVYKYDVFNKYLDKKSIEYDSSIILSPKDSINSLLDKISLHMIEQEQFFHVPSSIFDEKENELLTKMLQNDVILKDEQIIKQGMLRRNCMVVSFTFDEFRDFCITNYILAHFDEEKLLLFWEKMNSNNFTIREGVQKYIFYLSRAMSPDELLPIIKEMPEYEEMYWKYIWGFEDKYLTQEDKIKWKNQLFMEERYDKLIVNDLVSKYDCDYFKNINISLLMDVLDESSFDIAKYNNFIEKMFEPYEDSSYINYNSVSVWPYNYMIKYLVKTLESKEKTEANILLYRLTIYLLELSYYDTRILWETLYKKYPQMVIKIISEINNHKSSQINGNIREILFNLVNCSRGDEYDEEINKLYSANEFCKSEELSGTETLSFENILKIIYGDKL